MRRSRRPRARRTLTTLAMAAAAVLTLSNCGSADGGIDDRARQLLPPSRVETSDGLRINGELVADRELFEAARGGTVVLYSAASKDPEDITVARFEQETGLKVEITRLPTSKLAERALAEHGARRLSADIIRFTDPRLAREFENRNVFVPYRTPFHDVLIDQGAGVRDTFLTCHYLVNTVGYNSAMIEEDPPSGWEDLADPRYHGDLGVVAVDTGGTTYALAHFQIAEFGAEFLEAQGKQNPRIFSSTATQVDALARGEVTIASLSFPNGLAAEQAGAPIKLIIPERGVSGAEMLMGMTEKGVRSPAAQVFMNWSMSQSGQSVAAALGSVPARTDIDPVKSGEYQLPMANSPQFHLLTEEQFDQYATIDERIWKEAFNYMG